MDLEKRWTKNQHDAILARGGSVLVSAAAGSGKTAVLVQRVIERLTDKIDPSDMDRLLIVTFTNAAAAEMKERISSRIDELLEEDPTNKNLQHQQILLNKANISTIHSFCNDLIREYFHKLEISSEFRIADDHEMTMIIDEAIDNVLENFYQEASDVFHSVVETFSSTKDDSRLVSTIKNLYKFIGAHPYQEVWLKKRLSDYQDIKNIESTPWGKVILNYAKDVVTFCIDLTDESIQLSKQDEKLFNSFNPVLETDKCNLCSINFQSWDNVHEKLKSLSFQTLRSPRGYSEDPLKIKIANNRKEVKDLIKKLSKLFCLHAEKCMDDIRTLFPIVNELFRIVTAFDDELKKLKAERNVLDFTDLERFTIKLLSTPTKDGFQKTDDALSIGERFDEIMVDEYQDTNETQDTIFRALSNEENNLFVVGDVKQSIYGFRQAMPSIFLRRKESYQKYDSLTKSYPAKIILDSNFRSREGITEAVNFVFQQLMSREIGNIDYSEEERLTAAASYEDRDSSDMELHLISLSDSFSDDMDVVEAKHIADVIKSKMNTGYKIKDGANYRNLKFGDICVLLRSANVHSSEFVKELERNGIPAWSDSSESFLSTMEVSVMLSLLRMIDNPVQDIPLLSVLMSPLLMMTPDDIAKIRLAKKDVPLYFALKEFVNKEESESLKKFLKEVEHYRYLAATLSCSQLVNFIYDQTGFESIVQTMKNGKKRLNNLRMLVDYIKSYEASGYRGVSSFIRFIDRLQSQKSDLNAPAQVSESDDAVKVMSIHRSKGLEFPVCIIANASRKFNKEKGDVLFHSDLGLGIKIRDSKRLCAYTNIVRDSILLELDRDLMSEELRVLYVAMTRARENLIVLCSLNDVDKTVNSLANKILGGTKIKPHSVRTASSFADWMIMCALKHKDGKVLRELADTDYLPSQDSSHWNVRIVSVKEDEDKTIDVPISNKETIIDENLMSIMKSRFDYKYKFKDLQGIPAKVSVSELSHENSFESEQTTLSRPAFMSKQGMTSLEKGTALHAFMQFIDFKKINDDPTTMITNLINKGLITEDQASAINLNKVKKFLSSDIANRIKKSENILREFRFNINLDVRELNPNINVDCSSEYTVLQGAIDCAFEENGKFVIVDYKTDRVDSLDQLVQTYQVQLKLYKRALEECMGKDVSDCIIYSFHLGKSIRVL